ncbi:hypothetical protein CFOL_v3_07808 [Cephalotus follicularis]|uniref:Uncharacterized protein n=1 Tax=Cephalotus follicularis TaxID=3775 RepID=A0A1Q3B8J7_CEPFO|nr:hypothetical protein CFOL_v3_07808 [Cephalotus follicularis]
MGSCASVLKNSQESAMKLRLSFGSKTDKLPPSPFKDNKPTNGPICDIPPISHSATSFRGYGSKEESFFDSKPYLESDCEDDFFSVNGDFTPSRGSTPVHHNFSMGTPPRVNKGSSEDKTPSFVPEPSPTSKKKKLAELFLESMREDQDADEQKTSSTRSISNGQMEVKSTVLDILPKSRNGTPYVSGTNSVYSSERTANGETILDKNTPPMSMQCCLPSLSSCNSFSDRKKKMSPAAVVNDKA